MNRFVIAGTVIILFCCACSVDELILQESDLNRFIGRVDPDPKALNGLSIWLDPLIARSPSVTLDAGRYTFYLYARCTAQVNGLTPVCRLHLVQTESGQILFDRDVPRSAFGDGKSYKAVDWPFELVGPATVHFDVDMLVSGKGDFFLDSIGYADPDGVTRWTNDVLEHHVGVEMEDPPAIDGKAWANAHALAYGPYISLPKPGPYEAVFRLAISPGFDAESIATLDVFSHYGRLNGGTGNKTYAIRGLSRSDFTAPNDFVEISLPFEYDGAEGMEFRVLVYHVRRDAVRLDRITIRSLDKQVNR